jgi:hypothetical protein
LRALEHLGDLIGVANNIRLKEKRPLNLEDRSFVSATHTLWIGWMSGGNAAQASRFIASMRSGKSPGATMNP